MGWLGVDTYGEVVYVNCALPREVCRLVTLRCPQCELPVPVQLQDGTQFGECDGCALTVVFDGDGVLVGTQPWEKPT